MSVRLVAFGRVPLEALVSALADEGVAVDDAAPRTVAVVQDYSLLQPLPGPWLPVKPGGRVVWAGPADPCLPCLHARLEAQRPLETLSGTLPPPEARPNPAQNRAATVPTNAPQERPTDAQQERAAPALANPPQDRAAPAPTNAPPERPTNPPQDRATPAPTAATRLAARAIRAWLDEGLPHLWTLDVAALQSREHRIPGLPGCRRCPGPTGLEDHVSPLTGLVTAVTVKSQARVAHVASARTAVHRVREIPLDLVLHTLHAGGSGRGFTAAQARRGALAEAVEIQAALWRPGLPTLPWDERAVPFRQLLLLSEAQAAARPAWNRRWTAPRHALPRPTPPREWVPGRQIQSGEPRLLPAGYVYLHHPERLADSTGLAAGPEATLHALLELVERECVAFWWYPRARRPALDPTAAEDPRLDRLAKWLADDGWRLRVLDLTADLGVPACVALATKNNLTSLGFSAALTARRAMASAVLECFQRLPTATPMHGEHLEAHGEAPLPAPVEGLPHLLTRMAQQGLTAIQVDLSRSDLALPVVRVVVPGMRPFTPRFAPGRLYDVPVALGWTGPFGEGDLNDPIPV